MAENEVPKKPDSAEPPAAPLTREPTSEELVAKYEQLSAQTRAAGKSLLRMTAQVYFKRFLTKIDDTLAGLEGTASEKPSEDTGTPFTEDSATTKKA